MCARESQLRWWVNQVSLWSGSVVSSADRSRSVQNSALSTARTVTEAVPYRSVQKVTLIMN